MAETSAERAPPLASTGRDEEVSSAKQVFRDLDKAWRATRTYGPQNSVTRRFFEQLQALMIAHLDRWPVLSVIVDRTELRFAEEVVYRGEESLGESLAFRLYGDGVRELRFEHGVSPEDLQGLLEALRGHEGDESEEDDDVVTRLWSKDLATITFVTAEDILQAPSSSDLEPQEHGFFSAPPASFAGVLQREQQLATTAGTAAAAGPPAPGENLRRDGSGLVGFEVNVAERDALDRELETERAVEAMALVLSMLRGIVFSEQQPSVLGRALFAVPAVMDTLIVAGRWPLLAQVLEMLELAPEANPSLRPAERQLVADVLASLNQAGRLALFEKGLADPERPLTGLAGVCARLTPASVGPLCGVLANLTGEEQRGALRDTLIRLGAENPQPVIKALDDPRPQYVLDLMAIIVAWQQPDSARLLATLVRHPSTPVRAEALAGIGRLHAKGSAAPVLAFASDADREVRLHALRLLASGRYTATWNEWRTHIGEVESLHEQTRADKRLLFQALRLSAGDAAVPFWQTLLEARGWKQRQKKEETALLAVKELAALPTPLARQALEAGQRSATTAVKKACAAALAERSDG